jgi:hypothetical protein
MKFPGNVPSARIFDLRSVSDGLKAALILAEPSDSWSVTAFSVPVIGQFGHAKMISAPANLNLTMTISSGCRQ